MFLKVARLFGCFPYTILGQFNFSMYMFYIAQLAFALWCQLIRYTINAVYEWRLNRVDKLSICVHIAGLWTSFMPLIIQPLMTLKLRSDFERVASFFSSSSYPWLLRYVSHLGVALIMIITYFFVFGTLVIQRLVDGSSQVIDSLLDIHMHFIFGLDFLIAMQHPCLVHRVSMEFLLARNRLKYEVFEAVDYAQDLFRISKTANMVYGPQLVIKITNALVTMMTFAYGTITNTSPHGNTTIVEKMGEVMILTAILVELWCLCGTCDEARSNAKAFNNELFKIMLDSKYLCSNNELRLYVTLKPTVEFTACGFFSLGYPLVTSIIAAATTYLVILVQFSMNLG